MSRVTPLRPSPAPPGPSARTAAPTPAKGRSRRTVRDAQWAQLFELPQPASLPLQTRLRQAVVQAILSGRLAAGSAMPSSRELARVLTLSRNTVTAAYQQLVDEGFLQARARSGMVVAHAGVAAGLPGLSAPVPAGPAARAAAAPAGPRAPIAPDWASRVRRSLRDARLPARAPGWRDAPFPFVYGRHDPTLFPVDEFRECFVRSLARAHHLQWAPDFDTEDVPELVEEIRQRVLPARGVFALPEEILITVGAQQAFHLLAEALLDETVRLGFEEPGYPNARNAFALKRPQITPLKVDAHGLVVEDLPPLDYLFVTPSHQSPTAATLPLARRTALLDHAQARNLVVIEDDYEAENRLGGAPMPALKSLDRTGRVIYIGSLAKSLSPALRLGYIVAPRALVGELRVVRHAMVRHPSAFLQHAYALFLSLGHHESHARRVNQALQQRLALCTRALAQHLPQLRFEQPQGGASLWLRAPDWVDAADLAAMAQRHGVLIEPGDAFFAQPPYPCPWFRLRLSSITPPQIEPGIQALARAFEELARARGRTRAPGGPAGHWG